MQNGDPCRYTSAAMEWDGARGGPENRSDRTPEGAGWDKERQEDQGFAPRIREEPAEDHRLGRRRAQEDGGGSGQTKRGAQRGCEERERGDFSQADGRVPAEGRPAKPGGPEQEKRSPGRVQQGPRADREGHC